MTVVLFHPKIVVFCLIICSIFSSECVGQAYQFGFFPGSPSPHGVRIQSVIVSSPMTKLVSNRQYFTAESGDVIVAVNGLKTPNVEALRTAISGLASSNGNATISLRNGRDGQVQDYFIIADLKSDPIQVDRGVYVGLTESDAVTRAAANGYRTSVASRDGVRFNLTAVVYPDMLTFDIVNGIITGVR